ncbi:VWA domain-containing protein [Luteolibacter algae]|uniref:VWA domain-containing protein n=1 Tax=Luteolibacter algae TaxID=454151 RepID=A0ABW5D757_9BACT
MSFLYPWVLTLILPVLWWLFRSRSRASLVVASLEPWEGKQEGRARFLWLPKALRAVAYVFFIVALARPQGTADYNMEQTDGIAIQMLVDVSSSMDMSIRDADGKSATRMDVAKEMVESFIAGDGKKLKGRDDDLIGLITFARYADTRSPLTLGHDALLQIVRHLSIQERPNEDGTAYGDALAIAAARLKNPEELLYGAHAEDASKIKSRVIILLTDGENNSGAHLPVEAAGLAKHWGCRIYTVSLGDAPAVPRDGVAVSRLSPAEKVLEHISVETGGAFWQAHDFESLRSVYEEIDKLETSEISVRSFERVAEWLAIPLAIGLFALLLSLVLEATWLRIVP